MNATSTLEGRSAHACDAREPQQTIHFANALVSPTWHRLRANSVDIDLPDTAPAAPEAIEVFVNGTPLADLEAFRAQPGEFDQRVEASWAAFNAQQPVTPKRDDAEKQEGILESTALSPVMLETPVSFESGMGESASTFLRAKATQQLGLAVPADERGFETSVLVRITGAPQTHSIAALDLIARENARVLVTVAFEAIDDGEGILGLDLRIFASQGSRVTLETAHLTTNGWVTLDNEGAYLERDARVDVRHCALGANRAYIGLAENLCGTESETNVQTNYVGNNDASFDFNYLIRHRGLKTHSRMDAHGVLAGNSSKILRGTIDLAHGAKGADGAEMETVLLANEGVANTSVPIILCAEDDVAGNHGATIGHLKPDQLFYLTSRGFSEEQAERLFCTSAYESARNRFADASMRRSVEAIAASLGISIADDESDEAETTR